MKRFALIVCCVLFSAMSFAQVTTSYTLLGDYLVQTSRPWYVAWNKTFSCIDDKGNIHTAIAGAWMTYNMGIYGLAAFDGSSKVTYNLTKAGRFNQTASNATPTVTWSTDGKCTVLSNGQGHAVFYPPLQQSGSGTYSLLTDTASGIGTGILNVGTSEIDFQATGAFVQCFSSSSQQVVVLSTIMLHSFTPQKAANEVFFTGTGQHTNNYVNPCP